MQHIDPKLPFSVDSDGTIRVPSFKLPLSAALSREAAERQAIAYNTQGGLSIPDFDQLKTQEAYRAEIDVMRHRIDQLWAMPLANRILAQFPVSIESSMIADVPVEEFKPLDGCCADCVLINLHGGAFYAGQAHIGRVESIPIAHLGRYRVISVNYRQGYEHKFPAATEDAAAVFIELCKSYPADRIGIYGGSAGGTLTLQTTAWLAQTGKTVPGAIGVFSAGASGSGDGDYFSAIGTMQEPPFDASRVRGTKYGYFSDVKHDDPMVDPIRGGKKLLSIFPPSLFISGTRSFDLSSVIATHRAILQAGGRAELHVFDGHTHCFYYDTALPESLDAYDMVLRFFRQNLAH